MPEAIGQFSDIDAGESDLFTFDFVNNLSPGDAITGTPEWACSVAIGTDADPDSHIDGAATVFGTQTTQRVNGLLSGVTYVLQATVQTVMGSTLILWAYLPVGVVGC